LRYFCSLNLTVSHRIIQGKDCVLSPYVLSSCGLPLPSHVSTCNGQRSSQLFCVHYKCCSPYVLVTLSIRNVTLMRFLILTYRTRDTRRSDSKQSCIINLSNPSSINLGAAYRPFAYLARPAYLSCKNFFFLKVGCVRPKRGCLLTLAYYAFRR
jgi:hypothetical protein